MHGVTLNLKDLAHFSVLGKRLYRKSKSTVVFQFSFHIAVQEPIAVLILNTLLSGWKWLDQSVYFLILSHYCFVSIISHTTFYRVHFSLFENENISTQTILDRNTISVISGSFHSFLFWQFNPLRWSPLVITFIAYQRRCKYFRFYIQISGRPPNNES